jgi:predicted RNA-binding protein YlxR (DUF448 family)
VVVASTAASETRALTGQGPIRTCIGCRNTAVATELFRVVATGPPSGTDQLGAQLALTVLVVPDLGGSAPGRGAWLHRDVECAQQAQRRRAFARALRVPGTVDPSAVIAYVEREFG